MEKFATALLMAAVTALTVQAQVTSSIVGGKVTVNVDGTAPISILNLKSAGGHFIPIPPGTTDAPATPFTFLLANNAYNVSFAAPPGSSIEITGLLVTDVGYTRDNSFARTDMVESRYIHGAVLQLSLPTGVVLPEPSSGVLGALACMGLLGFRRRERGLCSEGLHAPG